jgi:ABC-type Fe3+-siderophore transport system permease subunit
MKPRAVVMLTVGAGFVLAGVVLEGTQQNPWNLVMSYLLPVAVIEILRRRATLWAYAICTVVVGLAIYGAAWTLGPEHAASPWAALVYVGLVAAALTSLMMPLRTGDGHGR